MVAEESASLLLGDPHQEEYQFQKNYIIPEMIKNFLLYFQKSILDQNIFEIQNAYENGYIDQLINNLLQLIMLYLCSYD